MRETLLATKGTDAARRKLCLDRGRTCQWNWGEPQLDGTPGSTRLTQEGWCQTCGLERTLTLTIKEQPTDLSP